PPADCKPRTPPCSRPGTTQTTSTRNGASASSRSRQPTRYSRRQAQQLHSTAPLQRQRCFSSGATFQEELVRLHAPRNKCCQHLHDPRSKRCQRLHNRAASRGCCRRRDSRPSRDANSEFDPDFSFELAMRTTRPNDAEAVASAKGGRKCGRNG